MALPPPPLPNLGRPTDVDPFGAWAETADRPTTVAGVLRYGLAHLASTDESGPLPQHVRGYLSQDGQVLPLFWNQDLWREVGWVPDTEPGPPGHGKVPSRLVARLAEGEIGEGLAKLPWIQGAIHAPVELIITVPSEVSQLLGGPDSERIREAIPILEAMAQEALRQLEEKAVRKIGRAHV